jgi:hypothetical protein
MDFELNRLQCGPAPTYTNCADNTPSGGKTPIHITPLRSQGDVMITYLLANGGTNPTILVRIWNGNSTSGSWGAATTITGAKSSINTSAITAANSYIGALSPFTFGEASIDSAALFGSGSGCRSFGSAYLRSRASDTDTTAGKDFIAPEPISLTNCGSVVVAKTDNAATPALLAGATFRITPGAQAADGTIATFSTLTDESTASHHGTATHSGYYCIDNVPLDSGGSTHAVKETAAPSGYDPPAQDTQNVAVTNTSTCDDRMNATTIVPDLTFVDTPQLGAIKIVKEVKDANCTGAGTPTNAGATSLKCVRSGFAVASGATFQICKNAGPYTAASPCDAAASPTTVNTAGATFGTVCVDGLTSGTGTTYYVHETGSGNTNISPDATDQQATLTGNTTCAGSPVTKTFTNTPLSQVEVKFVSSVGTGVTKASIVCTKGTSSPTTVAADTENGTADPALDDSDETFSGLAPDTYNCTVVVDP